MMMMMMMKEEEEGQCEESSKVVQTGETSLIGRGREMSCTLPTQLCQKKSKFSEGSSLFDYT